MSRTLKGEGVKIAQAAKDLNVTSVTIRRYLTEFDIETTTDDNGVKVLPPSSMEELKEIRRLKEDGLTNPKVLETLTESRSSSPDTKPKTARRTSTARTREKSSEETTEETDETADSKDVRRQARRTQRPASRRTKPDDREKPTSKAVSDAGEEDAAEEAFTEVTGESRPKHTLTCQTCGKSFEHMNPRLRDCLDCYRSKRKERRRGSGDRHKNVIQHPLAQQAVSKANNQPATQFAAAPVRHAGVRSYRKAIEETRGFTSSLKRRLERSDIPDGERRWLEQIYAYQLILHQGWRHLSEYRASKNAEGKAES